MVDVREQDASGGGDFGQAAVFIRNVHAQFEYSSLMVGIKFEESLGQTDEIIEIAASDKGVPKTNGNFSGHFLCGGFAAAAHDGCHWKIKAKTPEPGEPAECFEGIRDKDDGDFGRS
jgi:hypothetical protein